MFDSTIDAATIQAYRETEYHVHDAPPFVLRLGLACDELGALYKRTRTNCCAYLTAYKRLRQPGDDAQSVQWRWRVFRVWRHGVRGPSHGPGPGQ